jgi:hypothetical protein
MGFTLNPKHAIRRGLKRVIRKALRHACEHLQHAHETGVHETRKSVKKVRAVVALLQHVDTDGLDKDARRSHGTFVRVLQPDVEGLLAQGQQGADVGDKLRVTLVRTDVERGFIDFARA